MRINSLSFFGGTLLILLLSRPVVGLSWWIITLLLGACGAVMHRCGQSRPGWALCFMVLGFVWANERAEHLIQHRITPMLAEKPLQIRGQIADVPLPFARGSRFVLRAETVLLPGQNSTQPWAGDLRVIWFHDEAPPLIAGDRWQLTLHCQPPRGLANPHVFDYEQWLFAQGVIGSCQVSANATNQRLGTNLSGSMQRLRQHILHEIQQQVPAQAGRPLLEALILAHRANIPAADWTLFRDTGTSHLLAISGLHIGMVAGLGWLPMLVLAWVRPQLYLSLPAGILGSLTGALLATAYALLAGFTLPTQRALAMVLVMLFGLLWRRRIPFTQTLALALLVVLIIDPLAHLSAGFWLSFASVLGIYGLLQRNPHRRWWRFISVQLGISVLMLPLSALFFGTLSWVAPLANLVAIPWLGFLVLPLILLGLCCLLISPWLAGWCWQMALHCLTTLQSLLTQFAALPFASLTLPALPTGWVLVGLLGCCLLMLPRGIPGRWLGGLFLVPMLQWQPARPPPGAFELTVLDVGQGLASAIVTRDHALLFDAGPMSASGFDTGAQVVLPWLQARGVTALDTLIVSHADQDHSGGLSSILADMPVAHLLAGQPGKLPADTASISRVGHCTAGMAWEWDGVQFQLLHAPATFATAQTRSNNQSCVLRVSNAHHSVLLTADIERSAEYWLARKYGDQLASEVLLVPHHGSKTSSSFPLLKKVQPTLGIVTAGHQNRYGHPHAAVVKRYQDWGIPLVNTVDSGALTLRFPVDAQPFALTAYRRDRWGWYWR